MTDKTAEILAEVVEPGLLRITVVRPGGKERFSFLVRATPERESTQPSEKDAVLLHPLAPAW